MRGQSRVHMATPTSIHKHPQASTSIHKHRKTPKHAVLIICGLYAVSGGGSDALELNMWSYVGHTTFVPYVHQAHISSRPPPDPPKHHIKPGYDLNSVYGCFSVRLDACGCLWVCWGDHTYPTVTSYQTLSEQLVEPKCS